MKKITHTCSLTSEWLQELADQLGTKFIDNKIIEIPEKIGQGTFYFTPVIPGISVVHFDFTLRKPLKITRLKSDNELYIFHFDLSEHVNLLKVNNIDHEIGSYDKLDFAIIDNEIESSFKPVLKEKTLAIRILVDKNLLHEYIPQKTSKELAKSKIKSSNKTFFHYDYIDSNSILLIQSIKNKSVYDVSFDSLLKGITLKLLGNFFSKFHITHTKSEITEIDNEAITRTKNYLLNNLNSSFPSVTFLAAMAGMSESKYKALFKKRFNNTPNNLFITEKMKRAKELLESAEFSTLTEVLYELNYTKLSYFSSKYFEIFKRKPSDDFKKK